MPKTVLLNIILLRHRMDALWIDLTTCISFVICTQHYILLYMIKFTIIQLVFALFERWTDFNDSSEIFIIY